MGMEESGLVTNYLIKGCFAAMGFDFEPSSLMCKDFRNIICCTKSIDKLIFLPLK
jgi:hypothetical protein